MDFLGAGLVEEFHRLPQLGATDDRVVHKEKLLALNELRHGNLLHLGHLVAYLLIGGHEGAGPGGGILHEGTGKGDVAGVGVADGVGQTGVGNAGHIVHILGHIPLLVGPGHDFAVAVAHDLHVDPLVVGVGVAVIGPQEGADLHVLSGGGEGLKAVGGDLYNLPGAQLVGVLIAQLVVGEGLEGYAAALRPLADEDGQAAQLVPGGDDAVGGENEDGGGAVNQLLGVKNAVHQILLLVDEGGGELGGVDLSGAHGHELMAVVGEVALNELLGVVDDAHRGDGVQPQVGAHQQGLGIGVADAADAAVAVEVGQIPLKLGAEGGVFNVVDLALKAVLLVVYDHAAPAGAQVGVVIHSEENIQRHVPLGDGAKKASHCGPPKMIES